MQSRAFESEAHATPPCSGARATPRERVWVPLPHEREHGVYAPNAVRTQLTAHEWPLQVFVSDWVGHATPPLSGAVATLRVRVAKPVPQESEQADHVVHAETTQSTGHGMVLQLCIAESELAEHGLPPLATLTRMPRVQIGRAHV